MVIIFTVIRDGVSAILFSPVCIEGASHDTMHIKAGREHEGRNHHRRRRQSHLEHEAPPSLNPPGKQERSPAMPSGQGREPWRPTANGTSRAPPSAPFQAGATAVKPTAAPTPNPQAPHADPGESERQADPRRLPPRLARPSFRHAWAWDGTAGTAGRRQRRGQPPSTR